MCSTKNNQVIEMTESQVFEYHTTLQDSVKIANMYKELYVAYPECFHFVYTNTNVSISYGMYMIHGTYFQEYIAKHFPEITYQQFIVMNTFISLQHSSDQSALTHHEFLIKVYNEKLAPSLKYFIKTKEELLTLANIIRAYQVFSNINNSSNSDFEGLQINKYLIYVEPLERGIIKSKVIKPKEDIKDIRSKYIIAKIKNIYLKCVLFGLKIRTAFKELYTSK